MLFVHVDTDEEVQAVEALVQHIYTGKLPTDLVAAVLVYKLADRLQVCIVHSCCRAACTTGGIMACGKHNE